MTTATVQSPPGSLPASLPGTLTGPLYVYALVPADETPETAWLGAGLGEAPVGAVAADGLVALVSPAPPDGQPIDPTRRNMLIHTKLLERVLANATLLPLRFGTVAPSQAVLLRWLAAYQQEFLDAIAQVRGCVELGVRATWLDGVVYEEIVAADPALRALRDRLRARPPAETYYQRIELGRAVEAALGAHRAAETARLLARLSPLAEREAELQDAGEATIFSRAFLVRRTAEAQFDAAMEHLSATHAPRIRFKYIGAAPPYNFVRVRTDWAAT
jgi:hypothetical protein